MGEKGTIVGGHEWGGEGGGNLGSTAASAMTLLLSKLGLQEAGAAGMFPAGGISKIN